MEPWREGGGFVWPRYSALKNKTTVQVHFHSLPALKNPPSPFLKHSGWETEKWCVVWDLRFRCQGLDPSSNALSLATKQWNQHFFSSNLKSKWACSRYIHIDICFLANCKLHCDHFQSCLALSPIFAGRRSIHISVRSFDEACRFEDGRNGWRGKIHHHSHEGWFVWSRMRISLFFKTYDFEMCFQFWLSFRQGCWSDGVAAGHLTRSPSASDGGHRNYQIRKLEVKFEILKNVQGFVIDDQMNSILCEVFNFWKKGRFHLPFSSTSLFLFNSFPLQTFGMGHPRWYAVALWASLLYHFAWPEYNVIHTWILCDQGENETFGDFKMTYGHYAPAVQLHLPILCVNSNPVFWSCRKKAMLPRPPLQPKNRKRSSDWK